MTNISQTTSLGSALRQGRRALKLGQTLLKSLPELKIKPKDQIKRNLKGLTQTLARSHEASLIMAAIAELDAVIASLAASELKKMRKMITAISQKIKVLPAKAGIQKHLKSTGSPPSRG